jgi:hypothetical protein
MSEQTEPKLPVNVATVLPKINTVTLSRRDFSVINTSYDPEIKDYGDYRDAVAEMFFKKLKAKGVSTQHDQDRQTHN